MKINISANIGQILNVVLALVMSVGGFAVQMPGTTQAGNISQVLPETSDTPLQFTSQGHVLGFSQDGVTVASANHMVKVEFLNARAVAPEVDEAAKKGDQIAPPLSRVTYHNIWDGVTVVYEASQGSVVKSTYYVNATEEGTAEGNIRLRYNRPVRLDEQGNLAIDYDNGTMVESAPIAWQESEGQRKQVTAAYAIYGEREVGFFLGNCVPGIPVVIDPALAWNTFLGGSSGDQGKSIAVDGSGNVYVAGNSGATWGSPVRAFSGGIYDAFAAKLDSSGNLIWNTFLGGSGPEEGYGIAVDGSGNVYVTGYSVVTWGNPMREFTPSGADAFVAKLSSSGNLIWNTFLGGSGEDLCMGIAVDGSGNVYVAGNSNISWGSPVRAFAGYGVCDAFAAKINSSGSLTWNTFLGGSGEEWGIGIAVDGSGNVYLTGFSPATWGSPVRAYTAAGYDSFAAKLDSSGNLIWNTFLGGSGSDWGNGIAVDGSGNVYIAGYSGATWGSPVRAFTVSGITFDAFAAKLDSSGNLIWNTFLGGGGYIFPYTIDGIAVDGSGNVYVAGDSTEGYNAFAAKLNGSGDLTWNTFLGGWGRDEGSVIAVDGSGNVYVAGTSDTWGSPVRAYTANWDVFVAKIGNGDTTPPNYAIIVAGQGMWQERITNNHAANNAYRVLRNLGFNDEHIIYLNNDRPQDIDGDGNDETDDYARLDTFTSAIDQLKDKVGPDGLFVLHLTGHGIQHVFEFDLHDTENSQIADFKLNEQLNKFTNNPLMFIFINSCYSGSFITSLSGISKVNKRRIIITGARDDEKINWAFHKFTSDRIWGNLNDGMNIKDAFTTNFKIFEYNRIWLDDNGDRIGKPPCNLENEGTLAAATHIGTPGTEHLTLQGWTFIEKHSPGELRVYDSQGHVTGMVNGVIKEEIPDSVYIAENDAVIIFSPSDTYRYEIVGSTGGIYSIEAGSINGSESIAFTASGIFLKSGTTHQYLVDWNSLSQNGDGVTVKIDTNNDGIFDRVFIADNELTAAEYFRALGYNQVSTCNSFTGKGPVTIATNNGVIIDLNAISDTQFPLNGKPTCTIPFGFFNFSVAGIVPGSSVEITLTFPTAIPINSQYWKIQNGSWINSSSSLGHNDGDNILTLRLTDGGFGDADGIVNGVIVDPGGPAIPISISGLSNTPPSNSPSIAISLAPPVQLPSISIKNAAIANNRVAPGNPVTISASVVNTGTVNGSIRIKLYVDGEEDSSQGVTVESGGNRPVYFTVNRNQPGTYTVYVGNVPAGSFVVDEFADPNIILYISSALMFSALILGILYILRRQKYRY